MKKKKIIIIFIFLLAFYFQNHYAIKAIDDWVYAFIINENCDNYLSIMDDGMMRRPVTSIYDAILSQSRGYLYTNGRFLVHTLVQYFCGTMSMQTFVILNSIIFSLFTFLILRLINRKIDLYDLLFILSAIWILIPHKGLTFMGNISLSMNYLWTSVVTLAFVLIIESLQRIKQLSWNAMLFTGIFALIAGSLQESFSIGMSGALLLYCLLHRNTIDKKILFIFTAYMIGTAVCILSPANFGRTENIGGIGFHWRCLLGICSSPPIIITMIIMITITIKRKLLYFIEKNYFLLVSAIINLLFAILIAYNGRHQLTAVNVCLFIVILRLWIDTTSYRLRKYASLIFVVIAVISYYPILQTRKYYNDAFITLTEKAFTENNNGIVSGSEFEKMTEQINRNHLLECNYIMPFTFQDWDFYEHSLSAYLTKGKNNRLIEEIRK